MTRRWGEGTDPRGVPAIVVAAVDPSADADARRLAIALADAWSDRESPIRFDACGGEVASAAATAWIVLGDPLDHHGARAEAIRDATSAAEVEGVPVVVLGRGSTPLDVTSPAAVIVASLRLLLAQAASHQRTLRRERLAREAIRRHDHELAEAALLQREFLPKRLPRHERFECSVLWRPAWHVSGDIYDVVRIDEHHVGVFLADAVGHGVPAAILAMGLARRLEVRDDDGRPLAPSEVLRRLNRSLVEIRGDLVWFATAVYALHDLRSGEVRLASAGHPAAVLLRRDGGPRAFEASGGLLGIFEEERYLEHAFRLDEGDRLILHSDGLEPLFAPPLDSPDSLDGAEGTYLSRFMRCAAGLDAARLFEAIAARMDRPDSPPIAHDDVTVISIGHRAIAPSSPTQRERDVEGDGRNLRLAA